MMTTKAKEKNKAVVELGVRGTPLQAHILSEAATLDSEDRGGLVSRNQFILRVALDEAHSILQKHNRPVPTEIPVKKQAKRSA